MAPRKTGRGPGRPPRTDRDDGSSRARLIEAAATVFAARGYRAATVDAVLKEAGLSKGTFYWNFESKDELFLALLEERIERPFRALMEAARSAPPEATTAPVASSMLFDTLVRERDLLLLVHEYWSEAVRDERLRRRYLERQIRLRDVVAQTISARHESTGVPLTVPAGDLAMAFIALAEGLSLESLIEPDLISKGLFGEVLALMYDGLVLRAQRGEQESGTAAGTD